MKKLLEERQTAAAEIRSLADLANDKDHTWSAENEARWEEVNTDFDALDAKIKKQERAVAVGAMADVAPELPNPGREDRRGNSDGGEVVTEEHRAMAFGAWLRAANDMEPTERQQEACRITGVNPRRRHFDIRLAKNTGKPMWASNGEASTPSVSTRCTARDLEQRVAQTVTTTGGGDAIPTDFVRDIDYTMLAYGGPRQVARIIRTSGGGDLPFPTLDDTAISGRLLAINTTVTNTAVTFGQTVLGAYKYSSDSLLVPQELIEDEEAGFVSDIPMILGERLGRITATHYTTGTGSGQPNGVVTASTLGVTATSATAITSDEVINLLHSVDPAYRGLASCGFMMNDTTLLLLRKLKDGDSQYLWQPGLQSGTPNQILGFPYTINQQMPAPTTGLKPIVFGAFEKYVIRDVADLRLYRLEERYRDDDQTGFVAFFRTDADLLQATAIDHLIMA